MNEVATVIRQVMAAGIELWVEDGRLHYRAPEGAMTDELAARIREHKDTIMRLLAWDNDGAVALLEQALDAVNGYYKRHDHWPPGIDPVFDVLEGCFPKRDMPGLLASVERVKRACRRAAS